MLRRLATCGTYLGLALLLGAPAAWAVPGMFTYTGELVAENGLAYEGTVEVKARLFASATTGAALWEQDIGDVFVSHGVLQVDLLNKNGLTDLFADNSGLWLEFDIDGETLSPRQSLTAVPYAAVAGTAATLGSLEPADVLTANSPVPPSLLPNDALEAVSNGAITNLTKADDGGTAIFNIQDFPGPSVQATADAVVGVNAVPKFIEFEVEIQVYQTSTFEVTLIPPSEAGASAPIVISPSLLALTGTKYLQYNSDQIEFLGGPPVAEMAGTWALQIRDTDDNAPIGEIVATLMKFEVDTTYASSDVISVNGLLKTSDALVGGDLFVNGNTRLSRMVRSIPRAIFTNTVSASPGMTLNGRALAFEKRYTDTQLRIQWQDTVRCGSSSAGRNCRMEVLVDGLSCTSPTRMYADFYTEPSTSNIHRPQTITFYCGSTSAGQLAAGAHSLSIRYAPDDMGITGESAAFIGWSGSQGSLSVEEVF